MSSPRTLICLRRRTSPEFPVLETYDPPRRAAPRGYEICLCTRLESPHDEHLVKNRARFLVVVIEMCFSGEGAGGLCMLVLLLFFLWECAILNYTVCYRAEYRKSLRFVSERRTENKAISALFAKPRGCHFAGTVIVVHQVSGCTPAEAVVSTSRFVARHGVILLCLWSCCT